MYGVRTDITDQGNRRRLIFPNTPYFQRVHSCCPGGWLMMAELLSGWNDVCSAPRSQSTLTNLTRAGWMWSKTVTAEAASPPTEPSTKASFTRVQHITFFCPSVVQQHRTAHSLDSLTWCIMPYISAHIPRMLRCKCSQYIGLPVLSSPLNYQHCPPHCWWW